MIPGCTAGVGAYHTSQILGALVGTALLVLPLSPDHPLPMLGILFPRPCYSGGCCPLLVAFRTPTAVWMGPIIRETVTGLYGASVKAFHSLQLREPVLRLFFFSFLTTFFIF